jgi:hypothetical protein
MTLVGVADVVYSYTFLEMTFWVVLALSHLEKYSSTPHFPHHIGLGIPRKKYIINTVIWYMNIVVSCQLF